MWTFVTWLIQAFFTVVLIMGIGLIILLMVAEFKDHQ